jgi:hypothetical protein
VSDLKGESVKGQKFASKSNSYQPIKLNNNDQMDLLISILSTSSFLSIPVAPCGDRTASARVNSTPTQPKRRFARFLAS